jgi:bifunctional non-homologous end joining protein LigD
MARADPPSAKRANRRSEPAAEEEKLSRYREKRNFSKTPEPSGTVVPEAGEGLRFVIQKHAARQLHYDFRLELGGVYKSWAVAKGPSLDPSQKRLAIQVEDHPIDYGDFEGIIPKGEYGGGTVMIWDRGFWRPEGDPVKAYAKGHLAFSLDGEKLKGRWHLVRTNGQPGGKKEQWLLFKSGDEFARPDVQGDILEAAPGSVATRRSMQEIAEEKAAIWSSKGGLVQGELSPASDRQPDPEPDPKGSGSSGSITPSTIEGAREAAFPEFVEPCLALLVERPPEGDNWLHEIKFDGYRLISAVKNGCVRLLTRRGLDWTDRFPGIAEAIREFPAGSAILDGEAVVEDEHGVSSFSALQDALSEHRAATNAVLHAFDLMYLNGYDLRNAALEDRKAALSSLLGKMRHPSLRYSEHATGSGQAMLRHACRLGLEGIVSKRRNAPYSPGRHGEWTKAKCTNREEFVIGGYAPSTAARNAIGSLALGYYDDGKLMHVGRTGTGFTQKSAQSLYKMLSNMRVSHSPFSNVLTAAERRGLIFVEPKLVAEVEFAGWTAGRQLRQAAFKGLREDKPAEEVRLDMPRQENPKGPLQPERTASAKHDPAVSLRSKGEALAFAGIKLTHPDRILWQGQGLTKLGLAEYYASVAGLILPHIVNRPLALVRCPDGSDGECFFQKHSFAGLSDAVEIASLPEKDGQAEAIVIHDLNGLIDLVQADVLEIHPWGARIEDVEHPDIMTFDLDPGEGVEWNAVIEGAREVRQRLLDAGIESYVKTTGGKGLHVVSPLEPRIGWNALKSFARSIALAMEADNPSKYISTTAKSARSGKIFVDYLRNVRGATAVAAYSTRARPSAPISTPVGWDELGPELTSSRFNVANIGRRLAGLQRDPWEGFFSAPQRIAEAKSTTKSSVKLGRAKPK